MAESLPVAILIEDFIQQSRMIFADTSLFPALPVAIQFGPRFLP